MKVVHYISDYERPLQHIVWDKLTPPDMHLTECGCTYISKHGQPDRWTKVKTLVTCKKCRPSLRSVKLLNY